MRSERRREKMEGSKVRKGSKRSKRKEERRASELRMCSAGTRYPSSLGQRRHMIDNGERKVEVDTVGKHRKHIAYHELLRRAYQTPQASLGITPPPPPPPQTSRQVKEGKGYTHCKSLLCLTFTDSVVVDLFGIFSHIRSTSGPSRSPAPSQPQHHTVTPYQGVSSVHHS